MAEAKPRIEKAVGLRFKRPPRVESRSKEQLRQFLTRQLEDSLQAADIANQERVYKRLGMLPDSVDTRKLLVDLLSEQVVGFYDPRSKTLYVVEGSPKELVG